MTRLNTMLDLPDDLYTGLEQLAKAKNTSINDQIITILKKGLATELQQTEEQRRQNVPKLLEELRKRHRVNPSDFGLPDSTELIREDRNR
ncbi:MULTISPECIES: hypothetical protein [Fischerella]|nr:MULTISPECIES: hypothetical protein [Fischerella]MBD2435137.1 hypothetical protein [Fischerella sp. FACHB-380]